MPRKAAKQAPCTTTGCAAHNECVTVLGMRRHGCAEERARGLTLAVFVTHDDLGVLLREQRLVHGEQGRVLNHQYHKDSHKGAVRPLQDIQR